MGDKENTKNPAETYKKYYRQPIILNADLNIDETSLLLASQWNQLDTVSMEKIKYNLTLSLGPKAKFVPINKESVNEHLSQFSPSWKFKAVITKCIEKEEYYRLAVWNQYKMLASWNMKDQFKDDSIHNKGIFGCLKWNMIENMLAYISEKSKPKNTPYHALETTEITGIQGQEYNYEENYGECLTEVINPRLNILHFSASDLDKDPIVHCISGAVIPEHLAPASIAWSPITNLIVFVAFNKKPFKSGLTFITTHPSCLCYVECLTTLNNNTNGQDAEWKFGILEENGAFHCPTFSPLGDNLAYIENRNGGPHHSGSKLCLLHWPSKEKLVLCDFFEEPILLGNTKFAGIHNSEDFYDQTKNNGLFWSPDAEFIALSTTCGFNKHIITISTKCQDRPISRSKRSEGISFLTSGEGKWTLLCFKRNIMVASYSDPATPSRLMYARIGIEGQPDEALKWQDVLEPLENNSEIFKPSLGWKILEIDRDVSNILGHHGLSAKSFEVAFLYPSAEKCGTNKGFPLIVCPHGGPHSAFLASWVPSCACFVALGFCVLLVNYRGSSGYGEKFIDSLLGRIGDIDAKDVQHAVEKIINSPPMEFTINNLQVYCYGGSHGGFIANHLSAQYPDFYAAVACRNPVTNISVMPALSDIPEWSYVECGLNFEAKEKLETWINNQRNALQPMFDRSPISLAHKIKSPTLFLLGTKDLRVPHYQGLELYKMLKAGGISTKVYIYPDGHALDSPKVDMNAFIQTVKWFSGDPSK